MPIIHIEPYLRDQEYCTLVLTSEIRSFTVGNVSAVFDSQKIQVTIEDKGGCNLTSYPCARVVAQIPREGGEPAITDLRIDYTFYALQGNSSIPPWRQFSDHSYIQYPDPTPTLRRNQAHTCESYDYGHINLRNRFWANGTQTDDSMIYIFEPDYRMRACWADPCTGEGLFMVWVAGWDLNGTVHFATPITYTSPVPLNPPPQPGQPGYEGHR